MIKRESKFGIRLRHWIKANPHYSCSIETKQSTTESVPFACAEQAQLDYGMAIKSDKGILIRVIGFNGEPDYIYCRNMPAYIAIAYPSSFHLIDVETFIMEKARSKRKSLTSARAEQISTKSVKIINRSPL